MSEQENKIDADESPKADSVRLSALVRQRTQKDVAKHYAERILAGDTDWTLLNAAIKFRWSESGLKRVKTMAWKIVEAGQRAPA